MKKSVLITGCNKSGIGDALARVFQAKGLRVFAISRDLSKIGHLRAADITVLQLDVMSSESIRYAVEEVEKARLYRELCRAQIRIHVFTARCPANMNPNTHLSNLRVP
jgi:NAD(P)-dependent dehydrogenase (short-subunit alcohol dehydrogenase family)